MHKLLLIFSLLLVACGGSAVRTQARAVAFTRTALDIGKEAIETVCSVDAVSAAEDPEAWRDNCLAAIEGHDTTRALWAVWRDGFLTAVASDDSDALDVAWSLVAPLLEAYGELGEFLAELGVSVPALPFGDE